MWIQTSGNRRTDERWTDGRRWTSDTRRLKFAERRMRTPQRRKNMLKRRMNMLKRRMKMPKRRMNMLKRRMQTLTRRTNVGLFVFQKCFLYRDSLFSSFDHLFHSNILDNSIGEPEVLRNIPWRIIQRQDSTYVQMLTS